MNADTTPEAVEGSKMPLLDHLIELRQRMLKSVVALFVAFIVCFFFAEYLYAYLTQPLADILASRRDDPRMIFTALTEVFFTYVKVAFFAGAFISCPIFLTQLWLFVAPGLYKKERHALLPFLAATPILFFIGGALVYYVIFPLAATFLIGFEVPRGEGVLAIELEAKVGEYLSLIMKLIFAFGLCFQLPVLMTLLARVGLATSAGMAAKRKYAIVAVFVVAAVLTPPDPISQISLAVPIILLYEISIYMAKMVERKKAKDEAETAEEEAGDDVTPS
ncbi:MAG: twin-arginine translocase subunit TatC [Kiloniellales bacterium]